MSSSPPANCSASLSIRPSATPSSSSEAALAPGTGNVSSTVRLASATAFGFTLFAFLFFLFALPSGSKADFWGLELRRKRKRNETKRTVSDKNLKGGHFSKECSAYPGVSLLFFWAAALLLMSAWRDFQVSKVLQSSCNNEREKGKKTMLANEIFVFSYPPLSLAPYRPIVRLSLARLQPSSTPSLPSASVSFEE